MPLSIPKLWIIARGICRGLHNPGIAVSTICWWFNIRRTLNICPQQVAHPLTLALSPTNIRKKASVADNEQCCWSFNVSYMRDSEPGGTLIRPCLIFSSSVNVGCELIGVRRSVLVLMSNSLPMHFMRLFLERVPLEDPIFSFFSVDHESHWLLLSLYSAGGVSGAIITA